MKMSEALERLREIAWHEDYWHTHAKMLEAREIADTLESALTRAPAEVEASGVVVEVLRGALKHTTGGERTVAALKLAIDTLTAGDTAGGWTDANRLSRICRWTEQSVTGLKDAERPGYTKAQNDCRRLCTQPPERTETGGVT